MEHYLWLIPLGFVIGTIGTLIGAGGGFILAPILLLVYPNNNPETITSISLAVVFVNASSGSWSYARMARIDYKSGLLFAVATLPGAVLGALSTGSIPRHAFNVMLGALMIMAAIYLNFHRNGRKSSCQGEKGLYTREIIEKNGTVHSFSYNRKLGMGLSLIVGYVSSLLGIGGGIIHVPALVRLLNFPVHIATATSHFVLAIMALTSTIVHIASGSFAQGGVHRTICLAIGVLIGAQVGAAFSTRIHGKWIIRGLAIALGLVGIRILIMAF